MLLNYFFFSFIYFLSSVNYSNNSITYWKRFIIPFETNCFVNEIVSKPARSIQSFTRFFPHFRTHFLCTRSNQYRNNYKYICKANPYTWNIYEIYICEHIYYQAKQYYQTKQREYTSECSKCAAANLPNNRMQCVKNLSVCSQPTHLL